MNPSTQASSEHSVCFAVPEKEVRAVAAALESRFREALSAGRLSQVLTFSASIGTAMKVSSCLLKENVSVL